MKFLGLLRFAGFSLCAIAVATAVPAHAAKKTKKKKAPVAAPASTDDGDTKTPADDEAEPPPADATDARDATESPKAKPDDETPAPPKSPDEDEPGPESPAPMAARSSGPAPFARLWIGIGGALDFVELPQAANLCALDANANPINGSHAFCTRPDGTDFPSRSNSAENASLQPGRSGHLDGGIAPGDVRLLFAVDYAVHPNVLVGVRGGYVTNTYPGAAAFYGRSAFARNLHLEARGTYVFGDNALSRVGFAPVAFLGFGVSEFDVHGVTLVAMNHIAGETPVEVWVVSGPWFVAVGGGARYQFSPRAAFNAALRVNGGLGSPFLLTAGPEISFQYGF